MGRLSDIVKKLQVSRQRKHTHHPSSKKSTMVTTREGYRSLKRRMRRV